MIRLFYLVSSIDSAKEISDDLHEHDVTDWRFHIVRVGFFESSFCIYPL